jgi:hypothetical protein
MLLTLNNPSSGVDLSTLVLPPSFSALIKKSPSSSSSSPAPTLNYVSQVVFSEDQEEAAAMLDELGIYLLSVEEAQKVLLRHIDISSQA